MKVWEQLGKKFGNFDFSFRKGLQDFKQKKEIYKNCEYVNNENLGDENEKSHKDFPRFNRENKTKLRMSRKQT